ncbi:RNA chaperone Hfq [Pseudomonas sp. MWU12-2323]|uniref:RNA chaperone Hfq n=1 Tax=Pseudomonas sp. MWU12-2323 TaxID=2651296 RepID=UPI00128CC1E7|nr:RNA chaperone Hfq [Pseudomonas sp. MWU12-2323]MPQ69371.1 hypothetical protein [Pseudomonas sp. MWU12-2323]
MQYQPEPKRKAQQKPRFNYAVETDVDRCVREQNRFLDHCLTNRTELTLFSVTGDHFLGIVHNYDRETILFGGSGKSATPRLIFKRFIAMIIPRDGIELFLEYRGLGTSRRKNRKQHFIEAMRIRGSGHVPTNSVELTIKLKRGVAGAGSTGKKGLKAGSTTLGGAVVTNKPKQRRVTKQPTNDT